MESIELEKILECQIWTEVKKVMLRISCCRGIIWEQWKVDFTNKSPNCPACSTEQWEYYNDPKIEELINVIRKKWGIWGEKIKFGKIEEHIAEWTKLVQWNICNLQIHSEKLLQHVSENHMDKLNDFFWGDRPLHVVKEKENSKYCEESERKEPSSSPSKKKETSRLEEQKVANKEFKDTETNSAGNVAKRSEKNKKYYWGKPIKYSYDPESPLLPETCSEGGLNCLACMKLDLDSKKIICMHLINTAGRESYYEEDDSTFKWGAEVTLNKKKVKWKGKTSKSTWGHWWKLHSIFNSVDINKNPYIGLIIPEELKLDKK